MFIVHDHREIPDILKDPRDERVELAFMRRWESGCWLISRALSWKGVFPLSAIISTTPTCRKQKTCCWTRMCCIRLMAFLYSSGARWSCWVWVITAWKLFPMRFLLVCPSIVDFRVDNIEETQFGRQQDVWIPFRPIQSPFSPLPSAVWKPLVLSARFFKSLSTFGGIVRGQVCADCFCSLSPSL